MKIFNTKVYGLDESMIRSGYPMLTEIKEITYDRTIYMEPHMKRAIKLASCKAGSGHDNFLKGIIVQMDVEAPSYWWPQLQRYNFVDFISSQSKMHRLKQMVGIPEDSTETMEELLSRITQDFELTAGLSTNYLQLKTIYRQRKDHKLKMWREVFCPWIETLPMARGLITG